MTDFLIRFAIGLVVGGISGGLTAYVIARWFIS